MRAPLKNRWKNVHHATQNSNPTSTGSSIVTTTTTTLYYESQDNSQHNKNRLNNYRATNPSEFNSPDHFFVNTIYYNGLW